MLDFLLSEKTATVFSRLPGIPEQADSDSVRIYCRRALHIRGSDIGFESECVLLCGI